ncbi:MAG TPA: DUF5987 family protein [Solirubrobacteraceae bacterium]|jgi:hypothetical protein|nr:DUF5987 family protein [Solirubrobacteraceae bacterium]
MPDAGEESGPTRSGQHAALRELLSRRTFLARTSLAGLAALVASARPAAAQLPVVGGGGSSQATDPTLQAFADTIIPGRRVGHTESGAPIDPLAIAGVDPLPGAVEADALALYHHPEVGFDALAPSFLSDLESRSAPRGGDFLHLSFDQRVQVCLAGLDFSNSARVLWEAAAAIPFTAFCAAALVPEQTAAKAVGYEVMGLPGAAPTGYTDFSYRRVLSREATGGGSLP